MAPRAESDRGRARPAGPPPRSFVVSAWLLISLLSVASLPRAEAKGGAHWRTNIANYTGILIPGFASSRLRAWAIVDCPYSPFSFRPLDPVWLDTKKVMAATSCWLKCLMLDPATQADNPECRVRVDSGLTAITELDPGYITGPLSSVWREWVNWCVEFGIQPDSVIGVPYDWRIYPHMLETRDLYFHKLKLIFEGAKKLRGGPSLVFAHSMGNNVFRYFLEWLRNEIAPRLYQLWLDEHIFAYHAIAAPLLGAPEAMKGFLSGITFGLPIAESTARVMGNSFGASPWMYPFSPNCGNVPAGGGPNVCVLAPPPTSSPPQPEPPHGGPGAGGAPRDILCNENEHRKNASGWPVDIISIDWTKVPHEEDGVSAYPNLHANVSEAGEVTNLPEKDCSVRIPVARRYSAASVADGTFFRDIADLDPDAALFAENIKKWYTDDPLFNPLTVWERPPIKNVYCTYGVELKTEVGFAYAPSTSPYPDNWQITDTYFETEGGVLKSRSGAPVYGNTFPVSGDVTVPYYSLSLCKNWLGPKVNMTRTPQTAHSGEEVQAMENVDHTAGEDLYPHDFTRAHGQKYITYYEDSSSIKGRKTAVWELDKVDHRMIVQNQHVLREIWLETMHHAHPFKTKPFVSKEYREPMRDEDCFWDYGRARCGLQDSCEYRYVFGDVHLGQSCRLRRKNGTDHFERYL